MFGYVIDCRSGIFFWALMPRYLPGFDLFFFFIFLVPVRRFLSAHAESFQIYFYRAAFHHLRSRLYIYLAVSKLRRKPRVFALLGMPLIPRAEAAASYFLSSAS